MEVRVGELRNRGLRIEDYCVIGFGKKDERDDIGPHGARIAVRPCTRLRTHLRKLKPDTARQNLTHRATASFSFASVSLAALHAPSVFYLPSTSLLRTSLVPDSRGDHVLANYQLLLPPSRIMSKFGVLVMGPAGAGKVCATQGAQVELC